MRDFRTIKAWEKAHATALAVYRATASFPKDELYGLTSQMRRAAASVPTNIAEGCGCNTDADFARFCQIAVRSACELEYQLLLSHDLGYLPRDAYTGLTAMIVEVRRSLISLIQKLRTTGAPTG